MSSLNLRKLILAFAAIASTAGAITELTAETAWAKGGKGREKFITREGKSGKGDKTKVNFDEVDIGGQRKTPLGTLVTNNKNSKDYDFIKLRPGWHPQMIESASSLESGGR